jgi:hypothetical protein
MKRKIMLGGRVVLALIFLAGAAKAQVEFTLKPQVHGSLPGLKTLYSESRFENGPPVSAESVKKRPWVAALEIFFPINAGVWAFDRYVLNKDYSRISWASWKRNLSHGWIWDPDSFSTSFATHAYHGSQYFKTARSLGMNFWESLSYAAGGYVMWGYFFETDPPSINDLIMTTLGGINLGEIEFRLSSLVRARTATGGERTWRKIAAFLIDPIRGLNRLMFGDSAQMGPGGGQGEGPVHGTLSFSGKFVSETSTLSSLKFSPGLDLSLIYGMDSSGIAFRKPFDLFFLTGDIRYRRPKGFLNLNTYGLWFGQELGGRGGPRHVLGIFQHYDFINDEIIHMGGTSLTGGLVSLFPLSGGTELKTSAQLGWVVLGGSKNPYVHTGERDYNYGTGGTARAQAWLSSPKFGTLAFRLAHFQLFTIKASAPTEADVGHDIMTFLEVSYTLPVSSALGLRVEYGLDDRRQHFDGHPSARANLSRIGAAVEVRF